MENILQRIKQYADYHNISIRSIEASIWASNGVISNAIKKNSDIQSKWVSIIIEFYKDINPTWLLTGKGEMLIRYNKEVELTNEVNEPSASYGSVPRKEPNNDIVKYLEGKIDQLESDIKDMAGTIAVLKHQLDHTTKKTRV